MTDSLITRKLLPKMAIIVYADSAAISREYYLEQRALKRVNGSYELMAPVALEEETMKRIAKCYMNNNAIEMSFGGLIPSHILYASNKNIKTVVIWYRAARELIINFDRSTISTKEALVKVPAILYAVVDKSLYVYALMTDERPTDDTKLYGAPFFNVYHDGRVCLGTANVGKKQSNYAEEAARFENGFHMAEQNGGNSEGNCKTPLSKLWPHLIKSKEAFPSEKELKQHGTFKTLGQLIQKLAR